MHGCGHRGRRALVVLCLVLFLALVGSSRADAPRRPAKRAYNDYGYYVLELGEGSTYEEAGSVATMLEAELVEQVGELKDHYLLRAPFSEKLTRRTFVESSQTHGKRQEQDASDRDNVMDNYYDLLLQMYGDSGMGVGQWMGSDHGHEQLLSRLRTRSAGTSYDYRAIPRSGIVSLERQIIKKRVKREFNLDRMAKQASNRLPAQMADSVSQYIKDIASRFGINDPLFPKQWHLNNDKMQENSINVTDVWAQGITGEGIRVAIVDDGLDMHSDDLRDNFYAEGSWDYNDHTDLPEPRLSDDQHGTRCAGEIAAAKNDVCGVGIAYDAKVAGIRILSASISDADEASALNFGYQTNDIYSCSWGPPDDGRSMEAPSDLIYKSMLNGVQNGRGGRGSVFVFASGNGGAVDDQCNFDGYTNSIFSITISAIDRKGLHPFYSEGCSANMVVTYSSGSGDNIHTTDVGKKKCTDHHGGTSAAAPIAAGIFALALQVRPELTWRDMQHLCVQTAIQVNANDPDWQITHAGRPYNHKYGYGKLDAYRIVELAKTFELVKPQAWYEVPKTIVNQPMTFAGVKSTISITGADLGGSNFERLEHITVTVNAIHQRRGDMQVILESPNGIRSILARPRRFDDDKNGFPNWTFMSVKHWDENPIGDWSLTMLDKNNNNKNGTFVDWKMTLWGSSIDASKAAPYKMQNDAQVHLPVPPHHSITDSLSIVTTTVTSGDSTFTRTTTLARLPAASTKTFVKPTAHLPGDHGQQTGESDHPMEGLPDQTSTDGDSLETSATTDTDASAPTSNTDAEEDNEEENSTYLGPWTKLANSSSWLYVAAGSVIIFLGAGVAYILVRRHQRNRYRFQPIGGHDDSVPMSALERGRLKLGGTNGSAGEGRTKALYDAFALSDSEDEDYHDEDDERAYRQGGSLEERQLDDSYMSEFLHDDDANDSGSEDGRAGPRHSTPSPSQPYRDDVDEDASDDRSKRVDDQ